MVNYRPYPEYKTSGVEWIGDIPGGWEVRRLRFLIKEPLKYGANESAVEDDRGFPRYIRITDFDESGILREDTFRSLPFEKAKDYILEDGDILFARSGATVGKTFQFKNYNGKACFAGYLIKASPDEKIIKSDYVYLFTKSTAYDNWKNSIFSQATIQNIGADKYQEMLISFPRNEQEQIEIVNFLDQKTGQIDDLIQKKEKMIKLLKEKRAALINQAVTKGLNPNAKMKPSCIEWIGDIPEGWEVRLLKHIATLIDGDRGLNYPDENDMVNEGIPFLSTDSIKNNRIFFDNHTRYITSDKFASLGRGKLVAKDLIITMRGTIGNTAIFTADKYKTAFINAQMMIIRPGSISPFFLGYVLKSDFFMSQLRCNAYGTAQQQLSGRILGGIILCFPSRKQQQDIVCFLDKKTTEIDDLIQKIESAITKLREYRSSIITAAVTGKIDLCEVS